MQVHERLKPVPDPSGEGKTARLKIFSTCKNLIRCLSTIKADEKNCNDAAKEPHEVTHLPDSLRYFAVSRASVPRETDTRTPEEIMIDRHKRQPTTDAKAEEAIKRRMERSRMILDLREKYYKKYSQFLTQKQIERVYELESKVMRRMARRSANINTRVKRQRSTPLNR